MTRLYLLAIYITIISQLSCTNSNKEKTISIQQPMLLWYDEPALTSDTLSDPGSGFGAISKEWYWALPVGNGKLGAMVYGGIGKEIIQLNEETLRGGYKKERNNPGALQALPHIQKLIFKNKLDEASEMAYKNLTGIPRKVEAYEMLSNLIIDFPGLTYCEASNYSRKLSLDSAIATTEYTINQKKYSREVFASHIDDVIVCRISCDKPQSISALFNLERKQNAQVHLSKTDKSRIILEGQITAFDSVAGINKGMKFMNQLKIIATDGEQTWQNNKMHIENASEIVLLISASTNYAGRNYTEICDNNINKSSKYSYQELKQRHVNDYCKFYRRVEINLNNSSEPMQYTTDERVENVKNGNNDEYLSQLFFQYGRYLLISHSRQGDLPGHEHGIWWGTLKAPWGGVYRLNIDFQMNFWPAQTTNLSELNNPYFDLLDSISKTGKVTARKCYGANGWVAHHATDPYWTTAPMDRIAGLWPVGSAWLVRQLFEHYQFTQDEVFLRQRAYPLMKGAAEFIMDFLVKIPEASPLKEDWLPILRIHLKMHLK
ncbi:MAG: glycosyl hydrolase family 95 catalytic domain-containing protein [Bacteroidota bacterium]